MTLSDLITKLENADGPDREIDLEIYRLKIDPDAKWFGPKTAGHVTDPNAEDYCKPLPRYTESIDAAITSIPEGSEYYRAHINTVSLWCHAEVVYESESWTKDVDNFYSSHKSTAIALCIAALKAHEAREDK